MFAPLFVLAAQAAAGGVTVEKVPQIGIATNHARCIVRRIGVAPAEAARRKAAVADAIRGCRAFAESDFEGQRIRIGDRPVSRGWWSRMQATLDAVEADIAQAVATPKQYKIVWELPDGARVDAYGARGPLTSVRLIAVPL